MATACSATQHWKQTLTYFLIAHLLRNILWFRCYQWLGELRVLPANMKCYFWQHVGNISEAKKQNLHGWLHGWLWCGQFGGKGILYCSRKVIRMWRQLLIIAGIRHGVGVEQNWKVLIILYMLGVWISMLRAVWSTCREIFWCSQRRWLRVVIWSGKEPIKYIFLIENLKQKVIFHVWNRWFSFYYLNFILFI